MRPPEPMTPQQARALLGLAGPFDREELRRAFRSRMGRLHPDVNRNRGASDDAMALIEARRVLDGLEAPDPVEADEADEAGPEVPSRREGAQSGRPVDPDAEPRRAWPLGSSVMVAAPPDETALWLVDAAYRLGAVTFQDLEAGLVEATVEFVGGPTVILTLTTQGRAMGNEGLACTEVFVSMEAWSTPPRPELPDAGAVAELVAHHVRHAASDLAP
ncbi:MAG: J domain-containing protein [Microthrixaceae bacterium]